MGFRGIIENQMKTKLGNEMKLGLHEGLGIIAVIMVPYSVHNYSTYRVFQTDRNMILVMISALQYLLMCSRE